MQYDIFFSISQTPARGVMPSEAQMFRSFFDQLKAADELGYGVAWVAESHLSSEVQKGNRRPVIPHWQGEVGLNCNLLALAQEAFHRTQRIEMGSAVMNIVCMGGPIAHAERIASTLALHGLNPEERRRIHVGFSAGRFDFMNEASGIGPRDAIEAAAWPVVKGLVFTEACRIFLRLLRGDTISSDDTPPMHIARPNFRSDADWAKVQDAAGGRPERLEIKPRWAFERLKIIPQDWRRDLLQLIIGSHDPALQEEVNQLAPVQVFNLSITRPEVIDDTHRRMAAAYHPSGGPWQRGHMPRTTFVFLNEEPNLSVSERRAAARDEAKLALGAYWTALEGTLDPAKVNNAADNALIGDADEVAEQIVARFHPEDRLMLWFDFFNHDSERVIRDQRAFMERVAPKVAEKLAERAATEAP
ncbi:MAG: LLM class flavin-dependent oxidoreductase [Deltaproteobacteria bacterium]|nr:LLM class flavin-dependent oxidoreductase [Deltaproteobacteria bacterium]